ncbi:MAG: hypothetical protein AAGH99_14780 [Planctomycetota bacterium]
MKFLNFPTLCYVLTASLALSSQAHEYEHQSPFPDLPEGWEKVGDSHGEIAVASNGDIYVSVQGGKNRGLQVYSPEGAYRRNVPDAPHDFHGFVIRQEDGAEFIYGVGLVSGTLTKLGLDGTPVFSTTVEAIPEGLVGKKDGRLNPRFTSCAVAPDGRIYVADGYGTDNIHLFDSAGRYVDTWIGRAEPYGFKNLHKISIDLRYGEPRILGCDRANRRLIHLSLEGEWLGEYATGLRRPSATAFRGPHVAVAEIEGRISVLDLEGNLVASMGTNDAPYNGNRTPPNQWQPGVVHSPHGIAFDAQGNILITEYSKFGRIMKFCPQGKFEAEGYPESSAASRKD